MKKLVLTATFALASLGAFAANSEVKSKHAIIPVKNNVEITIARAVLHKQIVCSVSVGIGILEITIIWDCS
jgi:hypothetical protein